MKKRNDRDGGALALELLTDRLRDVKAGLDTLPTADLLRAADILNRERTTAEQFRLFLASALSFVEEYEATPETRGVITQFLQVFLARSIQELTATVKDYPAACRLLGK